MVYVPPAATIASDDELQRLEHDLILALSHIHEARHRKVARPVFDALKHSLLASEALKEICARKPPKIKTA